MARVTLKTIAAKCGVSISTVSLALSGKGKISQGQVEQIHKAARELGYHPNPLLASLASKRFRTGESSQGNLIALLDFPIDLATRTSHSTYRATLQHWASELGYHMEWFDYQKMKSYSDLASTLYRRGTQGIVISGQPLHEMFADREKWSHFSMVQCGRFRAGLPIHIARPDIFRSVKLAFNELRNLGYRRIGFGFGTHVPPVEDDEARHAAAMAMNAFYTEEKDRIPSYMGDFTSQDSFVDWVKKHNPDVVIGFSEAQWWYLHDAGYRIPEDIGFVTMHLGLPRHEGAIEIAGLDQRREQIARQSIILLDQLIRHNSRGFPNTPRSVLIDSRWVTGGSVREQKRKRR